MAQLPSLPNEIQDEFAKMGANALRAFTRELAQDLYDVEDVLQRYGMTVEDYEILAQTRSFQILYRAMEEEWKAGKNTSERVRLQSAFGIEDALPELFTQLKDTNNPLSARAALFTQLCKVAAIGNPPTSDKPPTEQFKIEINMGADLSQNVKVTVLPEPVIDVEDYLLTGTR
jgi:hypothetical protein